MKCVPISEPSGAIVNVEPSIDTQVGFTIKVITTIAPSGSFADGSKQELVCSPEMTWVTGSEVNAGGRFMITTLKEKGTGLFTLSDSYPNTQEVPLVVLIEGAIVIILPTIET